MAVLAVVGYLIYTGIRDTMTYYLTVPETPLNPAGKLSLKGNTTEMENLSLKRSCRNVPQSMNKQNGLNS
jgi:hypothetical protein